MIQIPTCPSDPGKLFLPRAVSLYNIVSILPYINMNSTQVCMCSPSWKWQYPDAQISTSLVEDSLLSRLNMIVLLVGPGIGVTGMTPQLTSFAAQVPWLLRHWDVQCTAARVCPGVPYQVACVNIPPRWFKLKSRITMILSHLEETQIQQAPWVK